MSSSVVTAVDVESWKGTPPARWRAFYVRVTQEESVKTDLSIPNQIARSKEIAPLRGWDDWRIYVEPTNVKGEWWVEKRPALRQLIEDIVAGRIIGICARHLDRLWRNSDVQNRLLALLRTHRVELWDFNSRHEFKSAHGNFTLQILGAASELEVKLTAERIREMKRGKARKGKTGGGPPPFGYTSQSRCIQDLVAGGCSKDEAYRRACLELPVGKTWYIDEKEAEVVRLIFHLYTSLETRLGTKRLVRYLNARGYKTRNGLAWLSNYARRLISNPAYAGFTTYDETAFTDRLPSRLPRHRQERFVGEHPPLISPELWEKAQAIKDTENNTKRVRSGPPASEVFSLTGIVRCPRCNSRMVGKASSHSTRRYYICCRRHLAGVDQCNFPLVNATALQHEVWGWLHEILSSPVFVAEHVERLRNKLAADVPDVARRLAVLERRQGEIRAGVSKYFSMIEASDDRERDAMLLERIRELRAELEGIEAENAELRAKATPLPKDTISVERVQGYLAKLRARVDERPEYQRTLFHEFRREHDLRVKPVSAGEFVVSVALRAGELFEGTVPDRLFTRVAPTTSSRGSEGAGSPAPGGPMKIRLCAPAAATSSARRAPCCPRTSARSTLAGPNTGAYDGGPPGPSSGAPFSK